MATKKVVKPDENVHADDAPDSVDQDVELVAMRKGTHKLDVHPNAVADHERLGYKVD